MVTCTIEIQKGRHKQMRGHVERKHKNYSNKDIDLSRAHYNETVEIRSRTELIHEHYKERQEELDKGRYEKGTKEKYRTPENYQALERNNNEYRLTAQVGDKEFYQMLKDHAEKNGIDEETLIEYYAVGFGNYLEEFEDRTKGLIKMQRVTTHFDETTPHIHMDVFAMGKTKKGHPSSSFDNASLGMFPDVTDTRERMSLFREQEDQALLNAVHRSMRQMYMRESKKSKNPPFKSTLERKTLIAQERGETIEVGVDHDEYKRRKLKEIESDIGDLDVKIKQAQDAYNAKKDARDKIIQEMNDIPTDRKEIRQQERLRQIKAEREKIDEIKDGFTPAKKKELKEKAEQEVKDLVDIDQVKEDQKQEIDRLNELHKQAIKDKKKKHQEEIDRLKQEHEQNKQKVYETKEEAIVRYELEYMDELAVRLKVEMERDGDFSDLSEQGAKIMQRSNEREKAFKEKERKERKRMEKGRKEDSGLEL